MIKYIRGVKLIAHGTNQAHKLSHMANGTHRGPGNSGAGKVGVAPHTKIHGMKPQWGCVSAVGGGVKC